MRVIHPDDVDALADDLQSAIRTELLAFSRKQVLELRPLHLNEVVQREN